MPLYWMLKISNNYSEQMLALTSTNLCVPLCMNRGFTFTIQTFEDQSQQAKSCSVAVVQDPIFSAPLRGH